MTRNKITYYIFIGIVIALGLVVMITTNTKIVANNQLIIKEQRTNVEYLNVVVENGDKIEVHWIHSVELTPWVEVYEITDQRGQMELKLIETRFQSFGAGVPDYQIGTAIIEDGFIVINDLEVYIERFKWIHSHDASYELKLNGNMIIETKFLPHHIPIEFFIEKG
ncbi:DUF1850 domain-containing protein [Bacillaceae bacterium IKA-2]|nr:DUF1850 domain-containing protein [Bacillaceae bacterium IKA-2]